MRSLSRPGGREPSGWRAPTQVAAGAVLFVVLAALVEAGAFTRIDQFALDHLMPWLPPSTRLTHTGLADLYVPFGSATTTGNRLVDLWTYPCSVLLSGLGVALALVVCVRRRRPWPGVALALVWIAGNAVEVVGKHVIERPALYAPGPPDPYEAVGYAHSFPSGHMIRGLILVEALCLVAPRARGPLLVWVALVAPFLVLSSAHTVSDVLGGLVAGLVLVTAWRELAASDTLAALLDAGLQRLPARGEGRATIP